MTKQQAAEEIKDWLRKTAMIGKALEVLLEENENKDMPIDPPADDRFGDLIRDTFSKH